METGAFPNTNWQEAMSLFDEYIELEESELYDKLRKLESSDPQTAACLRSLLENDQPREGILSQPVGNLLGELLPEESSPRDATGRLIGKYRVLRRIGQGGMGVVYEAQRADGEFEQRVAIKLLRWGSDAEGADARFSRERRILARLEHPGIARLLDGGRSSEGRPYLVMELVAGQPLDVYCDEMELSIEDRLSLFTEICHVVHYAHRQLVVHRDLKPSNILIDQQARVRLLDFGIAKLLSEDQDDGLTKIGQRIMTPEYAAPEQIEGGQITTATDVYALGLILFELLTGRQPPSASPGSMTTSVPRPSTVIAVKEKNETEISFEKIAESRGLSPPKLRRRLKGDLDLIVLKALKQDPEERYVSADAFADDIQRHLDGFPIRARNANLMIRMRSFLRCNRGPVAAIMAVLLALAIGLASTMREVQERSRQAQIAEAVSDFLVQLFVGSDPVNAQGSGPTALELLDRGARQLESDSGTPPEIRAQLMGEIGRIYLHLGKFQRGAHFAGFALLQEQELHGSDSLKSARLESLWGACLWKLGRYREAEASLKHALDREIEGAHDRAAGETLSALGALYSSLGLYRKAEAVHRQALGISRRQFGAHSVETATDMQNIASTLWNQGRLSEAEVAARESLKMLLEITGTDSVSTASALHNLGAILNDEKKLAEAENCFRRAVALREKIYGPEHPYLAISLSGLSDVLMKEGHQEQSLALAERSLRINRKAYGPDHSEVAIGLNNLANRYYQMGQFEKAENSFREALSIWRRTLPPEHPNITTALSNIGMILLAEGKLKQAEALLRESIAHERENDPPLYGRLCLALCNLGRILDAQGRHAEAIAELEGAQQLAQEKLDPTDSLLATIRKHLLEIEGHSEKSGAAPVGS